MTATARVEVVHANQDAILPTLIGCKIVRVDRERSDPGVCSPQAANWVTVYLEDGRKIIFGSWGYDSDGALMYIESAEKENAR